MKNSTKAITLILLLVVALGLAFIPSNKAYAAGESGIEAETNDNDIMVAKALGAAACVGLVAAAGAVGMALAISKAAEGVSRQPEAAGKIQTLLLLGLIFIETAIIYGLIVAILVIFVL